MAVENSTKIYTNVGLNKSVIKKKRTIVYWNNIKMGQHNHCHNLKIFITRKTFALGRSSHRFGKLCILENISWPSVWSVTLQNLHFKGYLALTLHLTPLSVRESGHATPKWECAEWMGGARSKEGMSQISYFMYIELLCSCQVFIFHPYITLTL